MNLSLKSITIVAIVFAAFLARGKVFNLFLSREIPAALTQQGSCLGKKMCTVVYLAPWCPACNRLVPDLRMLGSLSFNQPDSGVLIIVGQGKTSDENEDKKIELGEAAITDNDGQLAKDLGIQHFPTFLVINQARKVIHEDQDALAYMDETFGFSVQ
ncbi:MAG: hypothetical protein K2P81_00720 [Bacteriovoracaceae bacterium]|nr:hypothetical protein [Bacteriovoracaceae bacterium]